MKRPNILTTSTNNELAGSGNNSSWVQGRNCVYHESSTLQYRVSISTVTGWKMYGYFNDLEVASYVANIAILCNGCEDKYQLNSVGDKDSTELNSWRSRDENLILERKARSIFSKLQVQLAQIRVQEVALREKLKREADISRVEREEMMKKKDEEETALISKAPKTILLDLLQSDIGGDLYRKIRAEIDKRY